MSLQKYRCLDCFEESILQGDFLRCKKCLSENLKKVFQFQTTVKNGGTQVGEYVKQSIDETKEKIKETKKERMKYDDR